MYLHPLLGQYKENWPQNIKHLVTVTRLTLVKSNIFFLAVII